MDGKDPRNDEEQDKLDEPLDHPGRASQGTRYGLGYRRIGIKRELATRIPGRSEKSRVSNGDREESKPSEATKRIQGSDSADCAPPEEETAQPLFAACVEDGGILDADLMPLKRLYSCGDRKRYRDQLFRLMRNWNARGRNCPGDGGL